MLNLLCHVVTWFLLVNLFAYVARKAKANMVTWEMVKALLARIDAATTAIATEVRALKDSVSQQLNTGGLTQPEQDQMEQGLESIASRLEAIANTDPATVWHEQPNATSATTIEKEAPAPFQSTEDRAKAAQAEKEAQAAPATPSSTPEASPETGASTTPNSGETAETSGGAATDTATGSGDAATPAPSETSQQ